MRSLAVVLPGGHGFRQHQHDWHQLIHLSRGALAVEAEGRRWLLPPRGCLWIPAQLPHAVEVVRRVTMQTLYLHPDLVGEEHAQPRLLEPSALLRQVIAEALRLVVLQPADRLHASLAALLAALVARTPTVELALPLPRDPRALRLARAILARPGDPAALATLTGAADASTRTLERLFVAETALSIGRWRQRARLQHAVRLLAEGGPVNAVAFECGYESPSAFIAAFRREVGLTPGAFRADRTG